MKSGPVLEVRPDWVSTGWPKGSRWRVKSGAGAGAVATVASFAFLDGRLVEVCFHVFGGVQWFTLEDAEEVFEPERK